MKHILKITALLLVFFLALSCGAMKSNKTKTSESLKTETKLSEIETGTESNTTTATETDKSDLNVKIKTKTTVDDKDETVTVKTTYAPADPTKPAKFKDEKGNVKELDNAVVTEEKTTKKNNSKKEETAIGELNEKKDLAKQYLEESKKEYERQKQLAQKEALKNANEVANKNRKAWSSLNLLWLLIPLGLLLAWLNKSKIITWAKNIWWI